MKKMSLLIALLVSAFASAAVGQSRSSSLEIYPAQPTDRDHLVLSYTLPAGELPEKPEIYLYQNFSRNDTRVVTLPLQITDGKGTARYTLPAGVRSFLITIRDSGNVFDNNQGSGFQGIIYKDGQPLPEGLALLADMYAGWRYTAYKIDRNFQLALPYYQQAFAQKNVLKAQHLLNYLFCLKATGTDKLLFEEELKEYAAQDSLTADEYMQIARMYQELGNEGQASYYKSVRIEKFPEDKGVINNVTSAMYSTFYRSKDFAFKKKLYNRFIADYSFVTTGLGIKAVNHVKANMLTQMLPYYLDENLYDEWIKKVNDLDDESKESALWLGANLLHQKGVYSEVAEIVSKEAVDVGRRVLRAERDWRTPLDLTDKEVAYYREVYYAYIVDMYGQCLQQNKKLYEAKEVYRNAALVYGRSENTEINQRYVESLINAGMADSAVTEAGRFQALFKSTPFINKFMDDSRVSQVKAARGTNKRGHLINESLASFELKDINGEVYTKEKLEGKVVVMDFWASWCNSCIMGFEGMYNLTRRFKQNKDVVFLFINTFERTDQKNAAEIIERKNYDFKILFDEEDAAASKLKISGLPTKLVIDKKGRIRYKQFGEAVGQQEIMESVIEQVRGL